MKSKIYRCVATGFLSVALLCGTAFAANTVTTKIIQANYAGIKIVVDGIQITPKDANGNVVEPFASEGTTYLPVRAVGEALGKDVTWDGSTSTVYIGQVPGQAKDWMTILPPYQIGGYDEYKIYDGSDPKSYFSVAGVKHTSGVYLRFYDSRPGYALWNTNLQYNSMTFTVGSVDRNQQNTTLDIYLDGVLTTTYELKWDQPPKTITIPLNRAANVKLNFVAPSYNDAYYGIYDVSFS